LDLNYIAVTESPQQQEKLFAAAAPTARPCSPLQLLRLTELDAGSLEVGRGDGISEPDESESGISRGLQLPLHRPYLI